ncbi:MAG: Ferrous-iron efflux pump FieF, partial [Pseudomonadota bacterium]
FSSGFEGILIIAAAVGIMWASIGRVFDPQPLQQMDWGLALSVASSALNGWLAWVMFQAARTHRSIALEADARHLVTDVWTSAGVVLGLLLAVATGWLWLDALVAVGVALNILKEGGHLIWRSAQGLMDEAVPVDQLERIQGVLNRFQQADGSVRFDHLHTRQAAQRCYVDVHMHLPPDWTLARAAELRGNVERALMDTVVGVRATIELLPDGVEAHFHGQEGRV